jgi:hypothetical protein
MYMAVEGRLPFSGDNEIALLSALLIGSLDPPRRAGPLAPVLAGLMRTQPCERPNVAETAALLAKIAELPVRLETPAMPQVGHWHTSTLDAAPPNVLGARSSGQGGSATGICAPTNTISQQGGRPTPLPVRLQRGRQKSMVSRRRNILLTSAGIVALVVVIIIIAIWPTTPSYTPSRTITYPGGSAPFYTAAFSPNGQMLAGGDSAGDIYFWSTATWRVVGTIKLSPLTVNTLTFNMNGTLLVAATSDGRVHVWDVRSKREINSFLVSFSPYDIVALNPDGMTLATGDGSKGGAADLRDMASYRRAAHFREHDGIGDVESLAFSPNGKKLAIGYLDGYAEIWDIGDDRMLLSINNWVPGVRCNGNDDVNVLKFSPNGETLAVGVFGGCTFLWDSATGRLTAALVDPGRYASTDDIAFSPTGAMLITASDAPNITYLWDVRTGRVIANLRESALAIAVHGSVVATFGDSNAYLWNIKQPGW